MTMGDNETSLRRDLEDALSDARQQRARAERAERERDRLARRGAMITAAIHRLREERNKLRELLASAAQTGEDETHG